MRTPAGGRPASDETLAYYAFPEEHWRRIRTNNPLERVLREIRRQRWRWYIRRSSPVQCSRRKT
jgi:transposase-like protein